MHLSISLLTDHPLEVLVIITSTRPITSRVKGSDLRNHIWYEDASNPGLFVYRDREFYVFVDSRHLIQDVKIWISGAASSMNEYRECPKGMEFKIKI